MAQRAREAVLIVLSMALLLTVGIAASGNAKAEAGVLVADEAVGAPAPSPKALGSLLMSGQSDLALAQLGCAESSSYRDSLAAELVTPSADAAVLEREDLGIVSFSVPGRVEDVFASMMMELEEKGWRLTPMGIGYGVSGSKEGGAVRWLMMQCLQVGAKTSVVLQYR